MVSKRILAVPDPEISISELPEDTRKIICSDLRQHARENYYRLEWNSKSQDYTDMAGQFCDIAKKIYRNTELEFCEPGADIEPYERSMERHITLKLYSDDMEDLCNKAASAGFCVSELLENFVGDLIYGAHTNGSDERMYANQWFERCWFGSGYETSFLAYVVEDGDVDEVLNLWDNLSYYKSIKEPDEYDREQLKETEDELNQIFAKYRESAYEPIDDTLEKGMERLLVWNGERKVLMNEDSD